MTNPPRHRLLVCAFLLSLTTHAFAAPQPTVEEGWQAIQNLMFAEALSLFRNNLTGDSRSIELGTAVAILHRQPTTRSNIAEALAILEQLTSDAPGSPEAQEAAYLKARLVQLNPFEPDPERALQLYRQLIHDAPDTLFGQLAFLKWAGLTLYSPAVADADVPFEALEAEGAFLTDPDCRRSFHLLLAEAAQRRHHDDAFALRHYLSAHQEGLAKPDLRANVLTRIIVLAQREDRLDLARTHAATFVATFPRDIRITQIKELLADIDALEK